MEDIDFEKFLKLHKPLVIRISRSLGRSSLQEEEDLRSEAVMTLWELYSRDKKCCPALIYVIVYRRLCDYLRKNKKHSVLVFVDPMSTDFEDTKDDDTSILMEIKDTNLRNLAFLVINHFSIKQILKILNISQPKFYRDKARLKNIITKLKSS